MLYRRYKPDEFEELYAIEEVCFQPPLRFGRGFMRRLVGNESGATWVAEENGCMAGFAIVEWTEEAGVPAAYIETIEVLPEMRGRGAGGELLCRLENSARAAGARTIWLHVDESNRGAIRLYEAHGYRRECREDHYYGPRRAALVYAKALGDSRPRTEPATA